MIWRHTRQSNAGLNRHVTEELSIKPQEDATKKRKVKESN
jgi:hypothetical protein